MTRFWVVVTIAALIAGCAARGPVVDQTDVYMKHAGEPVPRVRYSSIRNWRPVGREMIMMDFGARGQYLFELSQECHSSIQNTLTVQLDTYQSRVIDITDRIIIDEVHRCRIINMRPVDMRAVRDELAGLDDEAVGEVETGGENH